MTSTRSEAHVASLAVPPEEETFRPAAVVGPLIALLALWLWLFIAAGAFNTGPNGKNFGSDFSQFFTAAVVTKQGGNPYHPATLVTTAIHLLKSQGVRELPTRDDPIFRVGNPPLFFWLLGPVTLVAFQPAALFWIAANYVLSALGLMAILAYFGWSKKAVPLVLFLAMPQVVLGTYYGNQIGLVFAAVAWALLLSRKYPFLAGLLLCVGWLKPQIALPAVFLIVLLSSQHRRPLLVGFCGCSMVLLCATVLATGTGSLAAWLTGLRGYSQDLATQPNLASLGGLYSHTPAATRMVMEVVLGGVGLAATVSALARYRQVPPPASVVAGLWILWFLVSPYAHFSDEIMLTIPIVALLGPDGVQLRHPLAVTGLYLVPVSLVLYSWSPMSLNLLSVLVAVSATCLIVSSRRYPRTSSRGQLRTTVT